MQPGDLPPPNEPGETDVEREERRLTPYLPLAVGAVVTTLLALLWRLL